jgi:Tfp pilus assembly protein PilX
VLLLRIPAVRRLIGAALLLGLVLLVVKWALTTAAILAVPFGVWWLIDRRRTQARRDAEQAQLRRAALRRAELEGRATVDAAGGCGWCGTRIAHTDGRGRQVLPLAWHRDEIDAILRAEGVAAPAPA